MEDAERFALARDLAAQALAGAAPEVLLGSFCEALERSGVPLLRAFVTLQSLDPEVGALSYAWWRAERRPRREAHARNLPDSELQSWRRNPLFQLYHSPGDRLRYRLDTDEAMAFPLLRELRAMGATDYVAAKIPFAAPGAGEGLLSSWATDRAEGFAEAEVAALDALLPALALAVHATALSSGAQTLLSTYLGRDVASRVLRGDVERGVPHRLDAVLWASDLAGFTRLADTEPEDRIIDLLNAYAEVAVDGITSAGGDVLKFTGDGLLAVFDRSRLDDAASAAFDAATKTVADARALERERSRRGLPISRLRIALHAGEVFYGNVGARTRLDFTVIGASVNEAARLCELGGRLDRDVVVSAAFHDAAVARRDRLVGLGRYALRGVQRPQHLFTPDAPHPD